MADNITAPATNAVIATDDIGGIHHPRNKVGFGTNGVYSDVAPDNPLPVKDPAGTEVFVLAAGITIAAGASTSAVTIERGGYYFYEAMFTGTAPSLRLERRRIDGNTWAEVLTSTAPTAATADPIGIPNGSVLRLTNTGANSLTAVRADLR